jgi:phosphopantothenoylcysteine decarboxylase/phosphopantothenate--cysteine ligase
LLEISGKKVLLVVSGGIAAYKCLELIRRLNEQGIKVRCILTTAGARFVTPLSLSAISGERVFGDLFSLTDESEIGHIRLSRDTDLVVVAPASADILARMAAGLANDLATAALLATDKPVLIAPAMNSRMWDHPATQANLCLLKGRGIMRVGPNQGEMAERGEAGWGRMAEPAEIFQEIVAFFGRSNRLKGLRCLVTSGPTMEPIDPVRFLANRSSGRQGHAIATALTAMGADTTLVSGPTHLPDPTGLTTTHVETAREMLAACQAALPVDIAVCAAAVADWRPAEEADQKIKKQSSHGAPALRLVENPDILATLSAAGPKRPRLVIGFAAETQAVEENSFLKRQTKGCDWILANDVSAGSGTFGGDDNTVQLITAEGSERWPTISKQAIAERLAERIAETMGTAS